PPGPDPTQAPPGEPPYESERPHEGEPGYVSGGGQHRGGARNEDEGGPWRQGG
ncbi:YihY/virulence factor BrkB family protein, partial [Streptomyces sp. SID11385]|nr:YihY/virulence factor BrkB family protein [Streptomyces sp. SID11385]